MKKSLIIFMVIFSTVTITILFAFKAEEQKIKGWFLAGSYPQGYNIGIESNAERNGHVAFLKSIVPINSEKFGTIMQMFVPEDYLGKRVKLTGYIKSQNVENWAGMWFRIDGDQGKTLGFDNMQTRPIKGTTDWKKYEIVLDVPANSKYIAYGVLLSGPGTVWLDDMNFEIAPGDTRATNINITPNKPQNTNFEEPEN
jgi:hypothetical protein